jgi:hypothetical protein
MDEGHHIPSFRREKYTNDQLKDLVRKAWDDEVIERERELGRPLTDEEKAEIYINTEFLERYHKTGKIPPVSLLTHRFSSITYLANLLQLPTIRARPNEHYFEGDKLIYIKRIRDYVKEHDCTKTELREAINNAKIPGVPSGILKYVNVFNFLNIKRARADVRDNRKY